MEREQFAKLVSPPRYVPLPVCLGELFRGGAWQMVWFVVLLGACIANAFLIPAVRGLGRRLAMPVMAETTGTVIGNDPIPREGGYACYVNIVVGRRECTVENTVLGYQPRLGETVRVAYYITEPAKYARITFPDKPGLKVLPTMRTYGEPLRKAPSRLQRLRPLWPVPLLLGFFALGMRGVTAGFRRLRVLRHGRKTDGQIVSVCLMQMSAERGSTPVYLVTFLFQSEEGKLYSCVEESSSEAEWRESPPGEPSGSNHAMILYDPRLPNRATALRRNRKGDPFTVDENGQLRTRISAFLLAPLLPLTALTALGIFFVELIRSLLA